MDEAQTVLFKDPIRTAQFRAVNTFHHGYKSTLYKQSVRTAL
jgi:hypothetical protein